MRNHASAAHPNQNDLTGLELVTFLQLCIREVINTPTDTVTAHTGRLLANIKKDLLDQTAVDAAAAFFDQLPPERADTLATACSASTPRWTAPRRLLTTSDYCGRAYGRSYAKPLGAAMACVRPAIASAETAFAAAARELIDLVDGTAYLTPEVRAVDMSEGDCPMNGVSGVHL